MKILPLAEIRRFGFFFRIVIYLGVLLALFATRRWTTRAPSRPTGEALRLLHFPRADSTLDVAGLDLAPELITQLVSGYRRDYSNLTVNLNGGGTTAVLEALVNQRVDVGFLASPPEPAEQALFQAAGGRWSPADTALWFPVALGALLVVRPPAGPALDSLSVGQLRDLLAGDVAGPFRRVHLAHPNLGNWSVLCDRIGARGDTGLVRSGRLVFHPGDAEVLRAVRGDREGLGIVSSFQLPGLSTTGDSIEAVPDLRVLAIGGEAGEPAMLPTVENIAYGRYPLFQHLYVASRSEGEIQGAMFVTQLTSDRGQRRVERAGYIPARLFTRAVVLSRHPVGEGRR